MNFGFCIVYKSLIDFNESCAIFVSLFSDQCCHPCHSQPTFSTKIHRNNDQLWVNRSYFFHLLLLLMKEKFELRHVKVGKQKQRNMLTKEMGTKIENYEAIPSFSNVSIRVQLSTEGQIHIFGWVMKCIWKAASLEFTWKMNETTLCLLIWRLKQT